MLRKTCKYMANITQKKLSKEIAIAVRNVSKSFRIPHEKITTLRGMAISAFKKNTYEEFFALDDVSFDVKKGEFFGIIGRNGSGKSTLLKILADIYTPDKGSVEVNGKISPFLELGIGFNPELSGCDNIYLNATVLGLTKKEIDAKFDDIVKFSGLERFIDQKLKNYSSGMQVRLAFSVSIHANRDILLMDEVLAVGDNNFQKKCINIFKNYRAHNKTVVLVTHDISTVRKYCDRALLLHNGKVLEVGDVDKVCDAYIEKNISAQALREMEENEKNRSSEKRRESSIRKKMKDKLQMITGVKVYNKKNKELFTTKRGESFFVTVSVDLKKNTDNLFLAVQIWDKNTNCFVSGNNTKVDEFDCNWKIGTNIITIEFCDHSLNNGVFFVKAVLFTVEGKEKQIVDEFSSLDNDYFFVSRGHVDVGGITYLKHQWKNEKK